MKILVVDDNASNRKLNRAILVRMGCLVYEAAVGRKAWRRPAESCRP